MAKLIIFDFDGVLVDSNPIKVEAWFEIFSRYPTIKRSLVADVLARNSATRSTRFDILRTVFEQAGFPREEVHPLIEKEAAAFDAIVQHGIFTRGLVSGARELLDFCSAHYTVYLNSGTPQKALETSVQGLAIGQYFKAVVGSPPGKEENLKNILSRERAVGKEVISIGDAKEDLEAAQVHGAFFIAIASGFYEWGKKRDFPVIPLPHDTHSNLFLKIIKFIDR